MSRWRAGGARARLLRALARARTKGSARSFDHQRLFRLHAVHQPLHRHRRRRGSRGVAGGLLVGLMHGNTAIRRQELGWELDFGGRLSGGNRLDKHRSHNHNQFGVFPVLRHGLEEFANDRDIPEERDLLVGFGIGVIEQATDGEALSLSKFDFSVDLAGGDGGNVKAGDLDRIREVEGADFGSDLEANGSTRSNRGDEVQANSVLLELNGNYGSAAARAR